MRVYKYFDSRYSDMKHDLRHITVPMPIKVKLLKEIQDTLVMMKKIFQDDQKVDQRSLISSICKSIELSSTIRLLFLVKFLRDFPNYNIDVEYITKNFDYIKNLTPSECSKSERQKILKQAVIKKQEIDKK